MQNRLHSSKRNRMVFGVCGGIAESLGIDPSIVRILTVVVALVTTGIPVVLIYLLLSFILPEE
ncbi:MAG: PspC domain-containing protein [Clostridia bacterium]|nr:PspC domain-containing protein [Clostridia bacterium]